MATSSQTHPSQALTGAIFVLLAAVAFSSKAVMVKLAYGYRVDAETLLALRMFFSAPFYIAIAVWVYATGKSAHLNRRDALAIVLLGVIGGYLPMWFDFAGLKYISAGVERVILFLYPTMVIIISAVLLGTRIGKRELFALVTSYIGVGMAAQAEVLTAGSAPHAILGATLIFVAAFIYAGYLVASGEMIPRMGATAFTAYIMLVTSLTSAAHLALSPRHTAFSSLPPQVYMISLLMAVIATVLPSFLLNAGIKRIGSSRAALMGTIGPVSTILLAWIFLAEGVSALQLLGTGFVIVGVLAISIE
ncbi:MAG TPA: DMT family transporter [Methylophilaceae bacterium]|jgi:drug/metabolite transporter (DMT)-like permease